MAVRKATERFARQEYPFTTKHNLAGYCGLASLVLVRLLKKAGVPATVEKGYYDNDYGHAWVRLPNGAVLDVTATQFHKRLPKVYVGPGKKLTPATPGEMDPVSQWVPASWVSQVTRHARKLLTQV